MNRVVLCGRLAARPKSLITPGGVPAAEFVLVVRSGPEDRSPPESFPCVAFQQTALDLCLWGERDHRLHLEGRLRAGRRDLPHPAFWVQVDAAYFPDPVREVPTWLTGTQTLSRSFR